MDTYILLVGGYRQLAHKPDMGGERVDANDAERETSDYIIKIKGLPGKFLKPTEKQRFNRHYCETCKRVVPKKETDSRTGCVFEKDHIVTSQYTEEDVYETQVYDKVAHKIKWLTPCHRIFINNSKGVAVWKDIWRWVTMSLPATKRPLMPKAVGNKRQWTIEQDEVPVMDFSEIPEEAEIADDGKWKTDKTAVPIKEVVLPKKDVAEEVKEILAPVIEMAICEVCGKEVQRNKINAHKWGKHKIKKSEG